MAYKRYFYKNGRKLGPYYYESYRDETGKVRKRYVGTEDPDKNKEKLAVQDDFGNVTPTNSKYKLVLLGFLLFILIIMDLSVIFILKML